jgi:hypothetical protein
MLSDPNPVLYHEVRRRPQPFHWFVELPFTGHSVKEPLDFRARVTAIGGFKAAGEFVQLLHPLFCCPGLRQRREASRVDRIDFEQVSSLLGVVVRLRCCPRDLAVQPHQAKRDVAEGLLVACGHGCSPRLVRRDVSCHHEGCLRSRPRVKGRLADSSGQPEERLQTDVRALRAIVAVDPQGVRPAGDALAAARYL